jgi:N-acetylglutamate synthase-like GNAT family acetyltransferase
VALHHWEAASSKGAALRREAAIKRLTRAGKLALADPPGFRPATADDLPWIRRTLHAFGLDDDRAEHAQFTVAMAGRARAGFARIKPRGSFFELSGVAVLPRYRRRGLGAALVRHLLERWPSRRAWIVTMRPEWFRRLGFETARPPKALARKLKAHGHCCATAMRRDIERM